MYRVIAMTLLLARSRLVLDFALTLHFLHVLVTAVYRGQVPRQWDWWALQVVSAVATVVGGGWGCRWRELRPISIGGAGGTGQQQRNGETGEEHEMVAMVGSGGRGDAMV